MVDRFQGTWPRPRMTVFGRRVSSFHVCGAVGILLATTLGSVLARHVALPMVAVACLLATGLATAVALALATKAVTGREALVYYHHEIAILGTGAVVSRALGVPVLTCLDLTALWLGAFLVCGRQGCLMVGCCHGRPHHWGVRYSEAHADEGFPDCYVGVRLLPIQALESLVVAAIVVTGALMVWTGQRPGTALCFYVVSYSAARIGLEELRGDDARPYWGRFSEAQWTSAVLMGLVLVGEWQGRLPSSVWHPFAGLATALGLMVLALAGRARHRILAPDHACEVAGLIRSLRQAHGGVIAVRRTSLAFGISTQSLGRLRDGTTSLYSMSHGRRRLSSGEARALSGLVANLVGASGASELRQGHHGVYHLLIRDGQS